MKYFSIDRLLIMLLAAAMGYIYQSQHITDVNQDNAMHEWFRNTDATMEAMEYEVEWLNNFVMHQHNAGIDSLKKPYINEK